SWFLGQCLRVLGSEGNWDAVVTYADITVGHLGGIYKAANFALVGVTRLNYHYEDALGNRIHKRQVWDRAVASGSKEVSQAASEGFTRVEEKEKLKFVYTLT